MFENLDIQYAQIVYCTIKNSRPFNDHIVIDIVDRLKEICDTNLENVIYVFEKDWEIVQVRFEFTPGFPHIDGVLAYFSQELNSE